MSRLPEPGPRARRSDRRCGAGHPKNSGSRKEAGRPWRVLDDTGGASAAEFALLAPVFLMMVAGIIELGLVFFASVTLDDATAEAARRLRTGEVQESADPLDLFQTSLCGSLFAVLDCGKVQFDVRGSSDFTSADTSLVLDEEGNPVDTAFAPGDSGEVTVVRVAYRWSFFTPLIGSLMSDNGTDSLLLMSTSVFQNEPYGAPS